MASYLYRCPRGHEMYRTERMLYGTAIICESCQAVMHRVPQPTRVNWNGLKPSAGQMHPRIAEHVAAAPRLQNDMAAKKAAHIARTAKERA